jgi:hypothetical protein
MRHFALPLLALAAPLALAAQQDHADHPRQPELAGGGAFPPGWSVRPDDGGKPAEVKIVAMAPGWHITTAASGIMYRDADVAPGGSYEVSARMHLFPEKPGHLEAFGLFIGGKDLQGPNQRYTYFLIRGDGTWKVKRRAGAQASDVSGDWAASPAIAKGSAAGPVANVVSVAVGAGQVSFRVNGQEVYSGPASRQNTGGVFGLRVNHNLSLHVESLVVRGK